ncbi:exodeoxyribonuclease VII small subunit [Laribacter hongkongensis]|uniref:exodeoxyribonuclease VII small subunit n=1 Tax=Laribacter hongkongensis TaxID=168471 RepID=UPI001EFE245D|nr:exodeoxyribonuclease VII small subunit [Laribacter hongkongensis]MCG8993925.1 exodeoxyribonuclease VII small subunit [Laribacter hongkongensis]MCG9009646.1 exodeoxyribonuclease VII small subunit [Laribacter hongkongensis]MCG9021954.1 exodeoxyribonuclease VII small subunit [Laribacter hongkongensis]MCG9046766.1 exodeoxyribonuclease VII small subunit [Laribacter hongkongensis]MCG9073807.1 exodeoxyribonuclease VII small subunit [Laribacter hongkongensis]
MAKSAKQPASFESAVEQLDALIRDLERGELPLEVALAAYKQGAELVKFCQGKLADAEQQLRVLEADALKPLDPEHD